MKKTLLALATLIVASTAAHADYQSFMQQAEQPYIGVDFQYANVDTNPSVQIGSILLRAGTDLGQYIGIEAQYSYGITDDDYVLVDKVNNTSEKRTKRTISNRGSYGLYLKPKMAINDQITAYALIGANYADYQSEGNNGNVNAYGTAFAIGGGAALMIDQNISVAAELMRYDSDIYALNLGMRYKF